MTVLRKMPTRFVAIDNSVARDKRLSFRARGVLVYLLSLPQDTTVSATRIASEGGEGRQAVLTALEELRAAGYYRVVRNRAGHGHFSMVTEVASEPVEEWITPDLPESTGVRFSDAGLPDPGEPTPRTKDKEQDETLEGGEDQNVVGLFPVLVSDPPVKDKSRPPRPRDPLFDAVAVACGLDLTQITESAGRLVGKVCRELRSVGADPAEVEPRAAVYREKFPRADLTPTALVKHWPTLKPTDGVASLDTWLAR